MPLMLGVSLFLKMLHLASGVGRQMEVEGLDIKAMHTPGCFGVWQSETSILVTGQNLCPSSCMMVRTPSCDLDTIF